MALFGNKDKADKVDDTATDNQNGQDPAPAPQYVTEDRFTALEQTIGGLAEGIKSMSAQQQSYQAPQVAPAPAEDPLKGVRDEMATIDTQLDEIEGKVDSAVYEGKGAGALLKKQRELSTRRTELQIKLNTPTADPRIEAGMQTIDSLTSEVMIGKMPHLALDPIKASYEKYITQLPIDQRMNPETKRGCYNLAVGENLATIQDAEKETWLRSQNDLDTQDPGGTTGQRAGTPQSNNGVPTPEELFSADALNTIKSSKHRSVENYVQALGYKDWEDYATTTSEEE